MAPVKRAVSEFWTRKVTQNPGMGDAGGILLKELFLKMCFNSLLPLVILWNLMKALEISNGQIGGTQTTAVTVEKFSGRDARG